MECTCKIGHISLLPLSPAMLAFSCLVVLEVRCFELRDTLPNGTAPLFGWAVAGRTGKRAKFAHVLHASTATSLASPSL